MSWFVLRRWWADDLPKEGVVVIGKKFRGGRMINVSNDVVLFFVFVSCEKDCS